ncbi:MAG: KEOPS complex subunit Pcc1 [Halovenus sp.]
MHEAVLSFEYRSPESARRVERALVPELGDIDDDRSSVDATRTDTCLEITVEAADYVALRAGLNTWCSLVSVAETVGRAESGDCC